MLKKKFCATPPPPLCVYSSLCDLCRTFYTLLVILTYGTLHVCQWSATCAEVFIHLLFSLSSPFVRQNGRHNHVMAVNMNFMLFAIIILLFQCNSACRSRQWWDNSSGHVIGLKSKDECEKWLLLTFNRKRHLRAERTTDYGFSQSLLIQWVLFWPCLQSFSP